MPGKILILATLDTKGEEALYLKKKLIGLGNEAMIMDVSMGGRSSFEAEISAEEVAKKAGTTFDEIAKSRDRAKNTSLIIEGAVEIARELVKKGEIVGVVGIGGSTGSLIAGKVMQSLPFGLPKLLVSSTASLPGLSTRYIDTSDLLLFHSVVEISGLNELVKNVMDRAAYAMHGLVRAPNLARIPQKESVIAMTMLGPCERCASLVRKLLEMKDFQVVGFSAAGIADRAMEEMIKQGLFDGVIDLAPAGIIDHLFGGMRDAGAERMEAAGNAGIPQVVSTCGLNHVAIPKKRYTEEHRRRRKFVIDEFRTWLRATPEELIETAKKFSEKLNRAKGIVKIVIPLKGWSSAEYPGSETYDPEEDLIFVNELKKYLKPSIEVRTVDANIEDHEFAEEIVKAFEEVWKAWSSK
jgi:uncharacterized protein (UPF0261 family)